MAPKFGRAFQQLKIGKEEIYKESRASERKKIEQDYHQIEEYLNNYYDKKIKAKDLSDFLGLKVLGVNGEHPSAQIYAFDCLMKSIAETEKEKDVDTIVEEILFDVAIEEHPLKKEYLLGILAYYSNRNRFSQLEEQIKNQPGNVQFQEEIEIITKINKSVRKLTKIVMPSDPRYKIMKYILDGFPSSEEECEIAKLVATYYGQKEIDKKTGERLSPTRMPDVGERKLTDKFIPPSTSLGGSGIPRYTYVLPEHYHPSKEKLGEADEWGIDLTPEASVFEGKKKVFIDYDIDPKLSRSYNTIIRTHKDKALEWSKKAWQAEKKGNFAQASIYRKKAEEHHQEIAKLRRRFREKVWQGLDPEAKRIFRNKDNIVVLPRTIADYPEKESVPGLLEGLLKDAKKDFGQDEVHP